MPYKSPSLRLLLYRPNTAPRPPAILEHLLMDVLQYAHIVSERVTVRSQLIYCSNTSLSERN